MIFIWPLSTQRRKNQPMNEAFKWLGKFSFWQVVVIVLLFIALIWSIVILKYFHSIWQRKREEKKEQEVLRMMGLTGEHTSKTKVVHEFPEQLRVADKPKFTNELLAMIQQVREFPTAQREVVFDLTNTNYLNSNASVGIVEVVMDVIKKNVVLLKVIVKRNMKASKKVTYEIERYIELNKSKSVHLLEVDK